MKTLAATLICSCIALGAGSAAAADDMMKKPDSMAKDGMMKDGMAKPMTLQECKDHMAMAKNDAVKKGDIMMKKDAMCKDMMKKGDMMKNGNGAMQSDGMASGAMK